MLETILGGALSLAGGLIGAHKAKKQLKEQRKSLQEQKRQSNQLYTETAYADPTQRASARYVLSRARDMYRDRNRAAEGKQAVVGGTEDSVATAKQQGAEGVASATAQVTAQADARTDSAAQRHAAEQAGIAQQEGQIARQGAQQTANATAALTRTVADVVDAVSDYKRDASQSTTSPSPGSHEESGWAKAAGGGSYIDSDIHKNSDASSQGSIFDDAVLAARTISLPSSNA